MERKIVHVVGTGTIGEPLIGLLCDYHDKLGIDEITFNKNTPLRGDRSKVIDLLKRGARLSVSEDSKDSFNLHTKDMNLQNKKKPTTFVEQCPTLERGFIESVRLWHSKVSKPKLVVIDTFQKIKPMGDQKVRNADAYEKDYYYLMIPFRPEALKKDYD